MYSENFKIANKFTQKWEKGYVNHPKDPGGATYNGVSLRFIKQEGIDLNEDGVINEKDIRYLYETNNQEKVDQIFWMAFWDRLKLDRIKYLPVQTAVFDTAVNVGRTQVVKFLQRACNEFLDKPIAVDGILGSKTVAAVLFLSEKDNGQKLAAKFCEYRMNFHNMLVLNSPYKDGRDYRAFAAGWRNRVNDLAKYIKGL